MMSLQFVNNPDKALPEEYWLESAYECPISKKPLVKVIAERDDYLPMLLAIIREGNKTLKIADGVSTCKAFSMQWTAGSCIELYEEAFPKNAHEPRRFIHFQTVEEQSHLEKIVSHLSIFDPEQNALTVRHVLTRLTYKLQVEPWLSRCLQLPIDNKNYSDFSQLASRLVHGYPNLEKKPAEAKALLERMIEVNSSDKILYTLLDMVTEK